MDTKQITYQDFLVETIIKYLLDNHGYCTKPEHELSDINLYMLYIGVRIIISLINNSFKCTFP